MTKLQDLETQNDGVVAAGSDQVPDRVLEEVEIKGDLDFGQEVPDLSNLAQVGEPSQLELNALYFDTPRLDLTNAGSTLRRRSGGSDAGWHLKIKAAGKNARREFHGPIVGARPPYALRQILPPHLRQAPLLPVARLITLRNEFPLLDESGQVLGLLSDDLVWASDPTETPSRFDAEPSWREIEFELVGGDREFLEEVGAQISSSAVTEATHASKLERALALPGIGPTFLRSTDAELGPAFDLLVAQVGILQTYEQPVLAGELDAVRRSEEAARRLRALAQMLDRVGMAGNFELRALRQELDWYEAHLRAYRDARTAADFFHHASQRLVDGSRGFSDQMHAELSFAMHDPRYEVLHDVLIDLLDQI